MGALHLLLVMVTMSKSQRGDAEERKRREKHDFRTCILLKMMQIESEKT